MLAVGVRAAQVSAVVGLTRAALKTWGAPFVPMRHSPCTVASEVKVNPTVPASLGKA